MPVGDGVTAAKNYTGAHLVAAGAASMSVTQALADVYDWIFHWGSPTPEQCLSLAVLTVTALGSGGFAWIKRPTAPAPEEPAKP